MKRQEWRPIIAPPANRLAGVPALLSRLGRVVRAGVSFVGLMAVGLIIAVVITAIGSGFSGAAGARKLLDINSFAAGLATGLGLELVSKLSWRDVPRRVAAWIAASFPVLRLGAVAALCVGVLVFY